MKRLSVALATIGLTAAAGAYAALPAATDPTLVNVPQLPGGFVLGVSGFYLEPSATNGDLDFASVNVNNNNNTTIFASKLHSVDASYDWGWGANVGYIFPNTGNDVNLSYFYFDSSNEDNHIDTSPFNINGAVVGLSPLVNGIIFNSFDIPQANATIDPTLTLAAAEASYRINQVDLTAGQLINVGCRLRLHPTAGLRYADVERKINSAYAGTSSFLSSASPTALTSDVLSSAALLQEDSDFSGIGPLASLDATYYLGMGFGAVAHADAALLIGSIDAKSRVFAGNVNTVQLNLGAPVVTANAGEFYYDNDSNRRVVPVGDLKLGLDYTYMFNNAANSDVTLELGWQASEYYDAIDRLATLSTVPTSSATPPTGGASQILGTFTSSLGIQGPYATLTFHA